MDNFIFLPVKRNLKKRILVKDILYCKADNTYTEVILCNGDKKIISRTLKDIEQTMNDLEFFRINRSILINIKHIIEVNTSVKPNLTITSGENFYISKSRIKSLIKMPYFLNKE